MKPAQKSPNKPKNTDISDEKIYTEIKGTLKCSQCDYKTNKKDTMRRHFGRHKDIDFECVICSQKLKGKQNMRNHMKQHSKPKPFKCQDCNSSFKSFAELERHVRYKHTHEKPYKCTECSYAAVEKSKLARHMMFHTGERPQCRHCRYKSTDQSRLERHVCNHTEEKPHKCNICHKEFTQIHNLKSHLQQVHSQTRQYKYTCNICYATYTKKLALRVHLQNLHGNIDPQQRAKCDVRFTDRYSLKNHIKSHKRSQKYKCSLCPYETLKKHQFIEHVNQHNGNHFKCPECDSVFMTQDSLNLHKQCHIEPATTYECNECGKVYKEKYNLKRHIQNCNIPKKLHDIQENYDSPHLVMITNKLKDGEVIVLPEKGGEKYVMIEIVPNENFNTTNMAFDIDSDKNEVLKDFYVEIEDNRLEIKLELKNDIVMTDEDEEPFFGF